MLKSPLTSVLKLNSQWNKMGQTFSCCFSAKETPSQELVQPENTPSKEEKSDFKKGQQQIKGLEPTLEENPKKTPSKKGNSACDRALQKLRQKQAKDLESPSKIKTPRPIGPDLCELRLTKLSNNYIMYDIDYRSHLFDLI